MGLVELDENSGRQITKEPNCCVEESGLGNLRCSCMVVATSIQVVVVVVVAVAVVEFGAYCE